jgi:hypothetical protein
MPCIGLEDVGDDGGPNNSTDEPEGCILHCVTTTARHLQTVAPVSGTTERNANYFQLAGALQCGLYPNAPLPFRTIMHGETALHLTRDPAMKTMMISDVMDKFNLPDLCGALADFLDRVNDEQPLKIGSRRAANADSPLPFNHLQVWTKVQVQNCSYHAPHSILPPQTINALPPSGVWTSGRYDVVLINTDRNKVWPQSGLKGALSYISI